MIANWSRSVVRLSALALVLASAMGCTNDGQESLQAGQHAPRATSGPQAGAWLIVGESPVPAEGTRLSADAVGIAAPEADDTSPGNAGERFGAWLAGQRTPALDGLALVGGSVDMNDNVTASFASEDRQRSAWVRRERLSGPLRLGVIHPTLTAESVARRGSHEALILVGPHYVQSILVSADGTFVNVILEDPVAVERAQAFLPSGLAGTGAVVPADADGPAFDAMFALAEKVLDAPTDDG